MTTADSLNTDERLIAAIEALTGGSIDNPEGPAMHEWREGEIDPADITRWLDANAPDWRDEAPLSWGEAEFEPAVDEPARSDVIAGKMAADQRRMAELRERDAADIAKLMDDSVTEERAAAESVRRARWAAIYVEAESGNECDAYRKVVAYLDRLAIDQATRQAALYSRVTYTLGAQVAREDSAARRAMAACHEIAEARREEAAADSE